MAEEVKATGAAETIAAPKVEVEDLEAKVSALEAEKTKLVEEGANYRAAYLKEHAKNRGEDVSDDERMEAIARKALADSRLAEIAREQDAIIRKALKENKELKLAVANRTDIPVSTTAHSEASVAVRDTLVTPEQVAAFKARGWSDKDIERYKRNLQKNSR